VPHVATWQHHNDNYDCQTQTESETWLVFLSFLNKFYFGHELSAPASS